jgi:hypothetical protein
MVVAALEEVGVVHQYERWQWIIDDSRALAQEACKTDPAGRTRYLVLIATTITLEAQNALLKILEEPPRGVAFHCFFPPGIQLLPTVRSRLVAVSVTQAAIDPSLFDALIRMPLPEQLALIEERLKQKDMAWVRAVQHGALFRLREWIAAWPPQVAARLYHSLLLIGTRGAASKMLLEDLVLTVAENQKKRYHTHH